MSGPEKTDEMLAKHQVVPDVGQVWCWGEPSDPALVLLHGFMQNGSSWGEIAAKLAEDYFVVAPDLLGHGGTGLMLTEDLSLGEYAGQVHKLILWIKEVQGNARILPIGMMGYSLGGRIAAVYAVQHPEMISALVLESSGLGAATEEERQARKAKTFGMIAALDCSVENCVENPLENFIDWWEALPLFAGQSRLSAEVKNRVRQERLANDPRALRLNLELAGQHAMPDLRKPLATLNKPILYLVGEEDVTYTKVARSLMQACAENRTSSNPFEQGLVQVSVVPGAGHNAHLERPNDFIMLVRAFLSKYYQ